MKHMMIAMLVCVVQASGQTAIGVQTYGGVSWFSMDMHSPLYNSTWDQFKIDYKGDKVLGFGAIGTWAIYPRGGLEAGLRYTWAGSRYICQQTRIFRMDNLSAYQPAQPVVQLFAGYMVHPFKKVPLRVQLAVGQMYVLQTKYRLSSDYNTVGFHGSFR